MIRVQFKQTSTYQDKAYHTEVKNEAFHFIFFYRVVFRPMKV